MLSEQHKLRQLYNRVDELRKQVSENGLRKQRSVSPTIATSSDCGVFGTRRVRHVPPLQPNWDSVIDKASLSMAEAALQEEERLLEAFLFCADVDGVECVCCCCNVIFLLIYKTSFATLFSFNAFSSHFEQQSCELVMTLPKAKSAFLPGIVIGIFLSSC